MRLFIAPLLVLFTVAAGCRAQAYGPAAAGAMPPPPRPGAVVKRWEHYCVHPGSDIEEIMERAGAAGWEMVGVATTEGSVTLCFKRPVDPAAPQAAP
jgi:hypothetical protein